MLDSFLFSVNNISLERWIEITWVSQNLEVTADSILSLILGLSLDVNWLMLGIKMTKDFV